MRPVVGVMRAVPGVRHFAPPPPAAQHSPPPPPTIRHVPPPPAAPAPPQTELSREWEAAPGEMFPVPSNRGPIQPPPAPLPSTPRPLPNGGRPTLITPPFTEPSPSDRNEWAPTAPPEGDVAPPPPAPSEPEAYYPVGRKTNRGPVASLWNRLSGFARGGRETAPAADTTRLVSHESEVVAD